VARPWEWRKEELNLHQLIFQLSTI